MIWYGTDSQPSVQGALVVRSCAVRYAVTTALCEHCSGAMGGFAQTDIPVSNKNYQRV